MSRFVIFELRCIAPITQRLNIGSMTDGTRRPHSLLTHADVMAVLHRCKYDPASAEASLAALQRRRESKYNAASASNDARSSQQGNAADLTTKRATVHGHAIARGGKSGGRGGSKGQSGGSSGDKSSGEGNRWEDWSEVDRAAFLAHLGDKVQHELSARNVSPCVDVVMLLCCSCHSCYL